MPKPQKFHKFDDVHVKSKNKTGMIWSISGKSVVVKTSTGLVKTTIDDISLVQSESINTTSATPGYNVPGAFGKKINHEKIKRFPNWNFVTSVNQYLTAENKGWHKENKGYAYKWTHVKEGRVHGVIVNLENKEYNNISIAIPSQQEVTYRDIRRRANEEECTPKRNMFKFIRDIDESLHGVTQGIDALNKYKSDNGMDRAEYLHWTKRRLGKISQKLNLICSQLEELMY